MPKIRVTTKIGDNGTSRLFSSETVSKTNSRLDAYGDIDELVSFLGIVRCHLKNQNLQNELQKIQKDLFVIGSELATTDKKYSSLPKHIDVDMVKNMDSKTENLNNIIDVPNDFIVPGNTLASAYLDYARALCRRCERKIVGLYEQRIISNQHILVWMNRLSDYLYLLARSEDPQPTRLKS